MWTEVSPTLAFFRGRTAACSRRSTGAEATSEWTDFNNVYQECIIGRGRLHWRYNAGCPVPPRSSAPPLLDAYLCWVPPSPLLLSPSKWVSLAQVHAWENRQQDNQDKLSGMAGGIQPMWLVFRPVCHPPFCGHPSLSVLLLLFLTLWS